MAETYCTEALVRVIQEDCRQRVSVLPGKICPNRCCIALRRAVVAGFIQLPGKREQGVLVLAEGIAQMSQYLGHADQLRRPAVLAGQGAEQLLLLGKGCK